MENRGWFCLKWLVIWCIVWITCANGNREYHLGAIFDRHSDNLKYAFEKQINFLNNLENEVRLTAKVQELDSTDSFAVSNAICALLSQGVYGIIGISNASALSTIQSYSNTFNVPFMALGVAQNTSTHGDYQLYIRPMYINALLDVIVNYGWRQILYIYDNDEGLLRLQQLFQAVNVREHPLDIDVKRVNDAQSCYQLLRALQREDQKTDFRVFLDIPTEKAEVVILTLRNDTEVQNHKFHFLLGELRMGELTKKHFEKGGINITGFQLLNYTKLSDRNENTSFKEWRRWEWPVPIVNDTLPVEPALVIDAVNLFHRALKQLKMKNYASPSYGYGTNRYSNPSRKCTDNSNVYQQNGSDLMAILKGSEVVFEGLTGKIDFDRKGYRENFQLYLYEITITMRLAMVGLWSREDGLRTQEPKTFGKDPNASNLKKRVTTILEEPYVMYKDQKTKDLEPKCGKDNFVGFCVDLTREIAKIVKFDYDICLVKDGMYGTKLDNQSWNGMIGELTRDETDMVIAPMTITSQRERVVDFTKPFMSLGISIMIRKTPLKKTSVFSFMDPLSYEIWMCILFAYIGVSVVLFLVSRFSPTEWHVEEGSNIKNDFTISNSLWYSLGAFMQQGCDISPRSVSGRIVGSVWWFFTLIIISSYTANLAAFLTVERMLTPIESADDLAKQTEIQYGILDSGSTKDFFKYSKFPVYERMWAYMQSATPSVFVGTNKEGIARVRSQGNYAFLIESTINDYTNMRKPCDTMKVGPNLDSKGYGIATPIGSSLRDQLTLAVLKLRESGELEQLRKEWWEKRSECGDVNQSPQEGGQAELTLEHVAGIFYILIAGLVLSVIIACLEFLYKSKVDSTTSKKSFGSVLRCKARLSFRGSLDRDTPAANTPLRKSMSTYTYTGPSQVGNDGFPDNLHTQV